MGGCNSRSAGPAREGGSDSAGEGAPNVGDGADGTGDDSPACFPLFHDCTTTAECCGPYRCLNITGRLACQSESPADAAPGNSPLDVATEVADGSVDLIAPADSGGDSAACFPLFHDCAMTADCCGPYRCLNITGHLACQGEGPVTGP